MAVVTSAVVGIAAAGYSAYQGFSEAAKQKELAAKADAASKKAMKEAKQKAETDYYEGLNVPMDAYEAEFEQNLAVQKQNVEALQEGDARALAAGVGRVGAQSQAGAEQTRIAMGEEISDLNKMKADSKEAINQQLIEMDVAYAKEQNQRQRDAEAARAQSINQGVQGVVGVVQGAASLAPLYSQSAADRRGSKLAKQFSGQKPEGMTDAQWAAKLGEQGYSRKEYRAIKKQGSKDAFWTEDGGFGWGHMEPAYETYDPNRDY
jgi:hypothetical protein